ncbi:hypothetical protein BH23VER1_BH23VER1_22770 [soil metagenome]
MNEHLNYTPTPTTITDINIPFGRLIIVMLKFMLASIPAILIMYAIIAAITLIIMMIFGGSAALFQSMGQ